MDLYKKYNLKKVINASGKMTILGVSKVSENVLKAQKFGGENFFVMKDLLNETGKYLANLVNAEDALIVSSASAGIAQSVAAVIGCGDIHHCMYPYDRRYVRNQIVLPKGHNVNYGTSVELMIQQGGGCVVEAGYANECTPEQVEISITENTAALMYVKSHHCVQKSMLKPEELVAVAKSHKLPSIIDVAAEEDVYKYIKMGFDLIIYSGAKAIEGPSSGLLLGKKQAIDWVKMQQNGIGRSMKIGKENILGFCAAFESYIINGSESGESMKLRLASFVQEVNTIEGLTASIVQDSAGRDIYRAKVIVDDNIADSKDVLYSLKEGDVAIYCREYQVNNGILEFDIRSVNEQELLLMSKRLKEIMEGEHE